MTFTDPWEKWKNKKIGVIERYLQIKNSGKTEKREKFWLETVRMRRPLEPLQKR